VMTWQQLAESDVETLQSMLDAAGSRFRMHRPASWPQQAALLASGQWEEFVALTETLAGS
jgi:large subunit ribosomal protein L27